MSDNAGLHERDHCYDDRIVGFAMIGSAAGTPIGGHMPGDDNLKRMKTLDDAWNAQDWEVFRKRHSSDTKVHWPGQPDPTVGRDAHHAESQAFFKSIENHLDNNPYRVMFASGDWTCTIAKWTGKMIGPWQ